MEYSRNVNVCLYIPVSFFLYNLLLYYASMEIKKRWRKKKTRNINYTPTLTIRQPLDGIKEPGIITLGHDELEALRLKDLNNLGIVSAAKQMGISKSLFAKIYNEATKKVATALVYGKELHIKIGQKGEQFYAPLL